MPTTVYPRQTVYLNPGDATQLLIVGPRIAPGLLEDDNIQSTTHFLRRALGSTAKFRPLSTLLNPFPVASLALVSKPFF